MGIRAGERGAIFIDEDADRRKAYLVGSGRGELVVGLGFGTGGAVVEVPIPGRRRAGAHRGIAELETTTDGEEREPGVRSIARIGTLDHDVLAGRVPAAILEDLVPPPGGIANGICARGLIGMRDLRAGTRGAIAEFPERPAREGLCGVVEDGHVPWTDSAGERRVVTIAGCLCEDRENGKERDQGGKKSHGRPVAVQL